MAYTRKIGKEFWFDLDNQTLWQRTAEVSDAILRGYGALGAQIDLDIPADAFRASFASANHPIPFLTQMQPGKQGLTDLANILLNIVDSRLADADAIRNAFEDFGQGVLFDDRRPDGFKIHKMDGDPLSWVGYHRWNAFMRAIQLFGHEPERWLYLNRCLGLAWGIQTHVNPADDVVRSPIWMQALLDQYRTVWMSLSVATLDWAFSTRRFQAPTLAELLQQANLTGPTTGTAPVTGYAKLQQILTDATPSGNPSHGGKGKFWLKPYNEFIGLSVYNQKLIADPGANRGANSALVKVLRGQLTPFPRMPMPPLPPVPDNQIAWIEQWIDAGLPET